MNGYEMLFCRTDISSFMVCFRCKRNQDRKARTRTIPCIKTIVLTVTLGLIIAGIVFLAFRAESKIINTRLFCRNIDGKFTFC